MEKSKDGFAALSPVLPGCVAVGLTRAAVRRKMIAAMRFHIEGLRFEGVPVFTRAPSTEVQDAWLAEVERRFSSWRRGGRKTIEASQVFSRIRKEMGWGSSRHRQAGPGDQ
jgi:predicted RNase H-like HicB family nuclease